MFRRLLAAAAAALFVSAPATAGELFGGLYVHDVKTPLDASGIENGIDAMVGYRGGRIGPTPIQPYVLGSLNTSGKTSFAAIGLSAKFGDRVYIRPGVGIAIHNGSAERYQDWANDEIDFGSRILFEPEIGVGARINDRLSVEASWVHMSHATLFSRQNPGVDNLGVRLNLAL